MNTEVYGNRYEHTSLLAFWTDLVVELCNDNLSGGEMGEGRLYISPELQQNSCFVEIDYTLKYEWFFYKNLLHPAM